MSDKKKEFKRLMEQFLKGASNLPCLFCEDENTVMSGFFIPAFAFPVDGIISAGRVYGYSMCQKCTDHFGPDSAKYDEAERKIIMGEGSYQYIGRTTFPFAEGLLSDGTAKEGTSACDARDDKPSACRDGLSSRRTRQRIREDMSSRQKHGTENILLHDIKSYDELKSYDRNKILQSETGYYIRQWHKLEKENPDVIISDGQQNNYVFVMRITDNARCKIAVERNDIRLNNILFLIDDKYVSIEEILRTASISMIGMKEPDEEAFKRHVISILSRAEGPYCNRKRIMYMETVHGDEIPIQKVDGRWHFYDSDFIKGYFTIYENGEKRDMDMDSLREYFRRNFCKGF
ncbi:MAG: hypothetical protein H8D67_12035, partial [Deltaproteobacteria bacterium]|nr:hypothetical protein [Deltaproteobacteria bacterium]